MRNKIILLVVASLALVTNVHAKPRLIEVDVDLGGREYAPVTAIDNGYVVIDSIVIDREQPAESTPKTPLATGYENVQFGFVQEDRRDYVVVFKNNTVEGFAREAISLAFDRNGYRVVSPGSPQAADAAHVVVTVKQLWTWADSIPGSGRKAFKFQLGVDVASENPGLANVGNVVTTDVRNGSRPKNWTSYRNTVTHSMKAFILDFGRALSSSQQQAQIAAPAKAVDIVAELEKLDGLRESGAISDEEYEQLKKQLLGN